MARPLKVIDEKLVERLASIHCPNVDIAVICECSVDTLERRFADVLAKGRANGKMSLRRMQWELASKGNATMQIWLGKQLLGQTDEIHQTVDMTIHKSKEEQDYIAAHMKQLEAEANERKQS